MHPFPLPENIGKVTVVLMFSSGREMVHWEQMGYTAEKMKFSTTDFFT